MSTDTTPQSAQLTVHIRWMTRRDMAEVLGIEHMSFDNPWNEEDFLRTLRQRNCIGMVAELGERVVGFMIYELFKQNLHVLSLVVDPEFRRQGVGRQMVEKLKTKLSPRRRTRLRITIKADDAQATNFLLSCGLAMTGPPDISRAPLALLDSYNEARELLKEARRRFRKAQAKLREKKGALLTALGEEGLDLASVSPRASTAGTQYYDFRVAAESAPSTAQSQPFSEEVLTVLPETC